MRELTLREIQLGSLEILKKIDEICQKEHLRYFLFYGTLIGAIRHNGFIPWDDDIDIAMPRGDYEKFLRYCRMEAEKLKPLGVIHYTTNNKYIYPIARMSDSRYCIEYNNVEDYGLGLFVDIYPLDGWGNSESEGIQIERSFAYDRIFIVLAGYKKYVHSCHNSKIRNAVKYMFFKLAKFIGSKTFIYHADEKAKKHKYDDELFVGCTNWLDIPGLKLRFNKELLEPVLHNFEDGKFFIPNGYDEILKTTYGDYMKLPPQEEQIPHHRYKAYQKNVNENTGYI